MQDRPAILLPMFIPGFGAAELQVLLDKMLARLPEDVRNGYMALSNCHPEVGVLRGILRTNCIGVRFPDDDVMWYRAVAINLSRCNHRCALFSLDLSSVGSTYCSGSCAPNATYEFDPTKFAFELRALCPIRAREQVTISYTDVLRSAASRSEQLLQLWHFHCMCSFCTLPPSEQLQSDKRRAEIRAFRVPNEGPLSRNHEAEMHAAIKAMVMCTEEQLWQAQRPMLAFLASRSLALGDASGWKKWAPKAAAMALACSGVSPHYYFYSATEPSLLLPLWNSKSLVGMLDEAALVNTVSVDCMTMVLFLATLHKSNN